MTDVQQREAARQFYYRWKGKGREDEEARSYWIEILSNILGVDRVTERVDFEKKVKGYDGNTKRIDVYIPETRVLIEQKSIGIALDKPQTGHNGMTPYEQAKMYDDSLPFSEKARWIVTSNFAEIWIYDMNVSNPQPLKLELADLQSKFHLLCFLTNKETKKIVDEMKLSLDAGKLVGKIYDAFLKQYQNPEDPETLKSLNKLCVRIVFCLYGEDAGIFGKKSLFHDYLRSRGVSHARKALIELFRVLDQPEAERDPYLKDDDPLLAAFPYVNGGLFSDENIEIPAFDQEIYDLLLAKASEDFNWADISPTIFGAVFESTLNPETRRSGGMHYTSIENIHKVIDPLFLDDLKEELAAILDNPVIKTRSKLLDAYQKKLASLKFLDPAAGSGNFLTETYLSLRKLENEVLKARLSGSMIGLGVDESSLIQVSIHQFYGIEINDFAVTVAKTALWIAESQMLKKTEEILSLDLDFLPLKSYANIVEGNALRLDWETIVPKAELNYIMGNPPFVGYKLQTSAQKEDLIPLYQDVKNIDYVAGWYYKASKLIVGTPIRCAFVSTNSITQGEQVEAVWKPLYDQFHIHIDFAYTTFKWGSEAKDVAAVHCVIVGFSAENSLKQPVLFSGDSAKRTVSKINPYLVEADVFFIEKRSKPLANVETMVYGSEPREGGYLILSEKEREELISETPASEKYIKRFVSSDDFINNRIRYCLWLENADFTEIRKSKIIMTRLDNCRVFRENSKQKQAHEAAKTPYLFSSPRQPKTDYLLIPIVSSEGRRYIPIGYVSKDIIVSNACFTISNASLYTFGILTSNVHMAWMRTVCGRLKSDYRYSNGIVYNNFPWPNPTDAQRKKIEKTAQDILDARALYPKYSFADLYDRTTMPPELITAHQRNDRAVMEAYGFWGKLNSESACVAELMKLYQQLTAK